MKFVFVIMEKFSEDDCWYLNSIFENLDVAEANAKKLCNYAVEKNYTYYSVIIKKKPLLK